MFGNLGFPEIMLILMIVLLVFGAKRLPEIGASFGKGIREFKRAYRLLDPLPPIGKYASLTTAPVVVPTG